MKRFKSYSLNRQTHRRTDRQTDRRTDGQTDTTENITYPHSRVVKKASNQKTDKLASITTPCMLYYNSHRSMTFDLPI